jgi:hypothetical protein
LTLIRATYADIQKIESLIRDCVPTPQKMYHVAKRNQTPEEVEKHFPGFMAFIDSTEQQIPRPIDKKRKKEGILFCWKEEKETCCKDTDYG